MSMRITFCNSDTHFNSFPTKLAKGKVFAPSLRGPNISQNVSSSTTKWFLSVLDAHTCSSFLAEKVPFSRYFIILPCNLTQNAKTPSWTANKIIRSLWRTKNVLSQWKKLYEFFLKNHSKSLDRWKTVNRDIFFLCSAMM